MEVGVFGGGGECLVKVGDVWWRWGMFGEGGGCLVKVGMFDWRRDV